MQYKTLVKLNTIAYFSTSGLSANEIAMRERKAARVNKAQQRSNVRGSSTLSVDNNRPLIRRAEAQARLKNRTPLTGIQRFKKRSVADIKSTFRGVGIKSGIRKEKGLGKIVGAVKGLNRTYTGKGLIGLGAVATAGAGYMGYKKLKNKKVPR